MNNRNATHAARLFPSGSGWFFASLTNEDRGFVHEVGVELRVAEPGRGGVECGVGEVEFRGANQRADAEAGDFRCDRQVVDEVEVLDAHFASRSSSSRS